MSDDFLSTKRKGPLRFVRTTVTPLNEIQRQAEQLATRLIDDLKAGRREKVGLGEIELEAANIAPRNPRDDYFRLVNWTIRYLVEKAAANERPAAGGKFTFHRAKP